LIVRNLIFIIQTSNVVRHKFNFTI